VTGRPPYYAPKFDSLNRMYHRKTVHPDALRPDRSLVTAQRRVIQFDVLSAFRSGDSGLDKPSLKRNGRLTSSDRQLLAGRTGDHARYSCA
jgi:hypothetical protein